MRFAPAAVCVAMFGATVHAEEARVTSSRPDKISVTIYRDLFALITESRTVDLPGGPVTLVFDGVAESLIPPSALVAGTDRPIAESNFDFERLTRASLLRKSIGKTVTLTRTNRATGRVNQLRATLLAAGPGGVVFRTADGNEALLCSGLPEKLSFEEVPDDLQSRPRLSIRLAAGTPGKREVRVSYLAHGFAWQADYLAHLDGPRMDLGGWITLRNLTGSTFRDAEVQVVAGKLNLLDAEEYRGTSPIGSSDELGTDDQLDSHRALRLEEMMEELESEPPDVEYFDGCYPLGITDMKGWMAGIMAEDIGEFPDANVPEALQREAGVMIGEELEEVVIIGFRASMAVRENLADYQLYRLPVRTNLNARQTKQVAFLQKSDIRVDRFYGLRLASNEEFPDTPGNFVPANVLVGWRNREADGLGEPLPAGMVRFFERDAGRELFAGDARLADNPVDARAELVIGRAVDLAVTMDGDEPEPRIGLMTLLTRRAYLPLRLRVVNAKPQPVTMEIRQGLMEDLFEDLRVIDASRAPQRKAGDYLWRFEVPANGEELLSYKVGGRIPDWDD